MNKGTVKTFNLKQESTKKISVGIESLESNREYLVNYVSRYSSGVESPEDIVQEVFTRILTKNNFRGQSSFRTFLVGYAKMILLEVYKRKLKNELIYTHFSKNTCVISTVNEQELIFWRKEIKQKIEIALDQLLSHQAQAIRLYYFDGLPMSSAAKRIGCSTKAFECLLYRTKRKLRQKLTMYKL